MRWLLFFLMLLLPTPVLACGGCSDGSNEFLRTVTLADPVSYRLVYTGITGLIFDEFVKVLSDKWQDDVATNLAAGSLSDEAAREQSILASNMELDYKIGKYADKRHRWWHYSSSIGDAPVYTTGPSSDVINVGPFRLDRKFKFKFNHYKTNITDNLRFKFKPSASFTSEMPFLDRVSMGFEFKYKSKGSTIFKLLLSAAIKVGIDLEDSSGEVSLVIELPLWGNGHKSTWIDYSSPRQQRPERVLIPRVISQQLGGSWLCCSGRIQPHDHRGE